MFSATTGINLGTLCEYARYRVLLEIEFYSTVGSTTISVVKYFFSLSLLDCSAMRKVQGFGDTLKFTWSSPKLLV